MATKATRMEGPSVSKFDYVFHKELEQSLASDNDQDESSNAEKTKTKPFTTVEKKLLSELMLRIDQRRILSSSSRSADIGSKKATIWQKIVEEFNNGTTRIEPVTKAQLLNLSKTIKKTAREKQDRKFQAKSLANFKKECSKTGGGKAPEEPENKCESDDEAEADTASNMMTNNLAPPRQPLLPKVGNIKDVYVGMRAKLQDHKASDSMASGDPVPSSTCQPIQSGKSAPLADMKVEHLTRLDELAKEQIKHAKLQQKLLAMQAFHTKLMIMEQMCKMRNQGLDVPDLPDFDKL